MFLELAEDVVVVGGVVDFGTNGNGEEMGRDMGFGGSDLKRIMVSKGSKGSCRREGREGIFVLFKKIRPKFVEK